MRSAAILLFAALAAAAAHAQDLSATLVSGSGETAFVSPYAFTATPEGSSSSIVVRLRNSSANTIVLGAVVAATAQTSSAASTDFTVTGMGSDITLAPSTSSSFQDVTVTFAPQHTGALTAYLQAIYEVQTGGCDLTSTNPSTACPSYTAVISVLEGTGAAPQIVLTYQSTGGQVTLQPGSSSSLNFGNVSVSSSQSITFTLTNETSGVLATPDVTLQTPVYNSTAFALNTSSLPLNIAASGAATFTVTFAPGQLAQVNATLLVGSETFPLTGTGVAVTSIDDLSIAYVDNTGVRTLPQAATPIAFGQIVIGNSNSAKLTFTVTNPAGAYDPVQVPLLAVTGNGFALQSAPTAPFSIAPGQSITFGVVFAPSASGTFTGVLAIGSRQFSLSGTATNGALNLSLQVDLQPLTSGQQAHVTVQSSNAASAIAIGQLSMTFTPSVAGVTDDPTIQFLATGGRELQVTIAQGAQSGTYNGQSQITFQTGTTAGTVTFTLTFPNQPTVTQSFTILPATIQISSGTAAWQSPNLVVTLSGYDNSYSAGGLSFMFYDGSGNQINASAITVDASSEFKQYFLNQSKAGGSFVVQATFPVVGDVTHVASVRIGVSNSSGTSTSTQTFQ